METPISDELFRRARQLADFFSARGVDYAFMGGMALNAWTIPVPTYDIDLCVALLPSTVPDVIQALDRAGFVSPPTPWLDSVGDARFQEFTVQWPFELGLRAADIFLATDPFQRSALARRRRVELEEGFQTFVVSPEDLLLYKLVAYRNKDRAAIDRLWVVRPVLDGVYVRKWARTLRVEERLTETLREGGPDARGCLRD